MITDKKGLITCDESQRFKDENGYLHVGPSRLTKADVNDYFGWEIPGWEKLGLDPDKIYPVYRPADELAKAVETFNGMPILIKHKTDSAEDPLKSLRVGVTGTEATFDGVYIWNRLVFHDATSIHLIENDLQKELSAGYRYDAVLEKGVFNDKPYEIKMTNIRCNHMAQVEDGRAGREVVVADSAIKNNGVKNMGIKTFVQKFRGKLALDSTPADLKETLKTALEEVETLETNPDASDEMSMDDLTGELDKLLSGEEIDGGAVKELVKQILAKAAESSSGNDSEPEKKETGDEEPAGDQEETTVTGDKKPRMKSAANVTMDAASIAQKVEREVTEKFRAKEQAAEDVVSLVGRVNTVAFDSAEAIYAFALKESGCEPDNHPATAYKSMVEVLKQKQPGYQSATITQDENSSGGIDISAETKRFRVM